MNKKPRIYDEIRRRSGPIENHIIDEFVAGHISRREFLRRGSMVGLSIPALSVIVAACGSANSTSSSSSSASTPAATTAPSTSGQTGTLRIAGTVPAATINPITVADEGGLTALQQVGEYLVFDDPNTYLAKPMLATSWTPNADGTVWKFSLRPGVTFHNGQPMTADDVVYTFQQQSNPKSASNALSVFTGLLQPSGVTKIDAQTVQFQLETPTGSFPWLISSDNYNCIIVPKGTDFSTYEQNQVGTGPFILKSYTAKVGASYTANPHWWGGKVGPSGLEWTFYATQQPQILALQGGTVDIINDLVLQGAQSLFNNPQYTIVINHTSQHRQLSMRCDTGNFTDKRVRQALALTLNRPAIISALFGKYAQLGNDSPFAPIYPSTDKTVPQRTQNIAQAKQLMAAAGHPNGFSTTLFTEDYQEIPQFAQIIKQAAAAIGININLKVETQGAYYGKATFGNSDWLDGEMSLVDYGHRGVPNVFLGAPLTSTGAWNAAHFKNSQYDALVKQYYAAVDLATQRTLAGQIQTLLLNETPLVIAYFFDNLSAAKAGINGVVTTGMGQMYLAGTTKA
jgi:peptide/nickel transport system substrate-binding protein